MELLKNYDVPERLINNFISCGYVNPTPIQMQAMPVMLQVKESYLITNNIFTTKTSEKLSVYVIYDYY